MKPLKGNNAVFHRPYGNLDLTSVRASKRSREAAGDLPAKTVIGPLRAKPRYRGALSVGAEIELGDL